MLFHTITVTFIEAHPQLQRISQVPTFTHLSRLHHPHHFNATEKTLSNKSRISFSHHSKVDRPNNFSLFPFRNLQILKSNKILISPSTPRKKVNLKTYLWLCFIQYINFSEKIKFCCFFVRFFIQFRCCRFVSHC